MAHTHTHSHSHHGHHHGEIHGHGHGDGQGEGQGDGGRGAAPYIVAVTINFAFVLIEAGLGVLANSTALLSDAAHNLSDVMSLALAAFAAWLAARPARGRRTFGFGKAGVLAALINAGALMALCGALAWEAAQRLQYPQTINPGIVIAAALAGVAVNAGTALLFARAGKGDLNARAAFLHLAADAAVSLAVVIGAGVVWLTGWSRIDPALSLIVLAVIAWGAWGILRSALDLALDAAPEHIDVAEVRALLTAAPGVSEVHDLHIWAMTAREAALTAHIVRSEGSSDEFLREVSQSLHERFGIRHATLQVEQAKRPDCADHG